jgi:hypothetical protein
MNEYSPIVSEFGSEEEEQAYLVWLKAKVEASRADPRPSVPHDEAMARVRQSVFDKTGVRL